MKISKILIADNDILFLDLLEDMLSEEGIEVNKARDGKEALEKLISDPPDVLITDLIMPKVSGEQLIEYVEKDIYVIALSGAIQEYEEIGNLKVDYYLHKADIDTIKKGLMEILDKIAKSEKRPSGPEEIPVDHFHPRAVVRELVADRNKREKIFQCLKEGLIIYDVDKRILWANSSACEILEKSKNDLLNSRLEDNFDEICLEQVRKTAEEVGKESMGEAVLKLSFGPKRLSLHFSNLFEYGSPGNFEGILLLQDITLQCLAEENLVHERDYFSSIMDGLGEGVMVIDRSFSITYLNQFFEKFLDKDISDLIGTKCYSALFRRDDPCSNCTVQGQVFDLGMEFHTDLSLPDSKGNAHLFKVSCMPLDMKDESVNSVLLTYNDTTRAERLSQYLKAAVAVSSSLLKAGSLKENINSILEILGKTTDASRCCWFENNFESSEIVYMSLKAEWCTEGLEPNIGKPVFQNILWQKDAPRFYQELSEGRTISCNIDEIPETEHFILTYFGSKSILLIPLNINSRFEGFLAFDNYCSHPSWKEDQENLLRFAADSLTKAFEYENSLKELKVSETRYRDIYDNTYDIWYLHDMEGRIIEINPAVKRIIGYGEQELLTKKIRDLIHERYRNRFDEYLKDLKEKKTVEGFMRVVAKSGESRILEYRNWLVELPDGRMASRGLVRDVSEKLKLEYQLRRAQKIESIGTLAAGISHNFRNILTGIMTNAQILELKKKDDPEVLKYADRINELSRMGADLVTDLLQFSRKTNVESKRLINLKDILDDTLDIVTKSFSEDISIMNDWPDSLPVYGDASSLSQVFMNLCTNARDAMPRGGRLTLKARVKGKNVIVDISDTGLGIDDKNIDAIFDPFYTTKEAGQGTGLGLYTAYGIVKGHDGDIEVNSAFEKGTTFSVILPVAKKLTND